MDILVTKRLTLRPPLEVDIDGIARGLANWNVSSMLARVRHPYNRENARAWVEKLIEKPQPCLYTIHREQLIGTLGVTMRDGKLTLGYWLAEPWWGKGYATEATRAALARSFRHYQADAVTSYALADNAGSLRVMEKLGFEITGEGTHHNVARDQEMPHIETSLSRERFEERFGSLETGIAA